MAAGKSARRDKAIKKAKKKRLIIISVSASLAVALVAILIVTFIQQAAVGSRVFENGPVNITLLDNGHFALVDCSLVRNGTYTENENEGVTTVVFVHNNETVYGIIEGDVLTLPDEWDAGKGHDPRLKMRKR